MLGSRTRRTLGSRTRRTLVLQQAARRRRLAFYETVQQGSGRGSVVDADERLPRAAPEADGSTGTHDDHRFPERS